MWLPPLPEAEAKSNLAGRQNLAPSVHGRPAIVAFLTGLPIWLVSVTVLASLARRPVHVTAGEAEQMGLRFDTLGAAASRGNVRSSAALLTEEANLEQLQRLAEPDVAFFAAGTPSPQGSKRAFVNKKTGKVSQVEMSKRLPDWRRDVRAAGEAAMADRRLLDGPLLVSMSFIFPRPRSHYGTGRNADALKPTAPTWMSSAPDVSKLARGVEDALNSVVWTDDARVAKYELLEKRYGDRPGVHIAVRVLG